VKSSSSTPRANATALKPGRPAALGWPGSCG
jgi:hypothetical protein